MLKFPRLPRQSLQQVREHWSRLSQVAMAKAIGVKPPNISRLECQGGRLEMMSVARLRQYLRVAGYELRLVAVPVDAPALYADVIEIVDPDDAEAADIPADE